MSANFALRWSRSKVADPFTSILTFPRGYVGTIPSVKSSMRGGWVYHPVESTEKKPVTLGRAEEGRDKAANLIEFLISQTYEANNWEIPINAVPRVEVDDVANAEKSTKNNGAAIVFPVKNYGYMKLAVSQEHGWGRTNNKSWFFEMALPTVIVTSLSRQIVTLRDKSTIIRVNVVDKESINSISDLFINDIIGGYTEALEKYAEKTGKVQTFNRNITVNEIQVSDIVDMLQRLEPLYDFKKERWTEATNSWKATEYFANNPDGSRGPLEAEYQISKGFLMSAPEYRTVAVTQAFTRSAETLKEAFETIGMEVEILTSTDLGIDGEYHTTVTGIKVSIPPGMGGDRHNRDGHVFTLTNSRVEIECGYVTNEERYIDDASRQALSDMKNLLEG